MKAKRRTRDNRKFYATLAGIAIVGVAVIAYAATRPGASTVTTNPNIPPGSVEGYVMGSPDAPVEIVEYADFECPGCAQFAIVTEPQVRELLVATGKARFRFFDFPLNIHRNTRAAHLAAACANDQGKFWEMHDRIFQGQDSWRSERTRNPKGIFEGYARQIGIDTGTWESCYDDRRHEARIEASVADGIRRQIQSTPTFIVGNQRAIGAQGYDALKGMVDAATPRATPDSGGPRE